MGQKRIQNEVWVLENQHRHGVLRCNRAWCLRSAMVIACRQSSSNSIEGFDLGTQIRREINRISRCVVEKHCNYGNDNCKRKTTTSIIVETMITFIRDGLVVWIYRFAEIPHPLVWFSIFGERDGGRSWLLAVQCERLGGSIQCERGCKQRLHVIF